MWEWSDYAKLAEEYNKLRAQGHSHDTAILRMTEACPEECARIQEVSQVGMHVWVVLQPHAHPVCVRNVGTASRTHQCALR